LINLKDNKTTIHEFEGKISVKEGWQDASFKITTENPYQIITIDGNSVRVLELVLNIPKEQYSALEDMIYFKFVCKDIHDKLCSLSIELAKKINPVKELVEDTIIENKKCLLHTYIDDERSRERIFAYVTKSNTSLSFVIRARSDSSYSFNEYRYPDSIFEFAYDAKEKQVDKIEIEKNYSITVKSVIEIFVDRFTKIPQVYAFGITLRTESSYTSGYFLFDPKILTS